MIGWKITRYRVTWIKYEFTITCNRLNFLFWGGDSLRTLFTLTIKNAIYKNTWIHVEDFSFIFCPNFKYWSLKFLLKWNNCRKSRKHVRYSRDMQYNAEHNNSKCCLWRKVCTRKFLDTYTCVTQNYIRLLRIFRQKYLLTYE